MVGCFRPRHGDVASAVAWVLVKDLQPLGDMTSGMLDPAIGATAQTKARNPGRLAGCTPVTGPFHHADTVGKAMALVGPKRPDMRLVVEASGAITVETIDSYTDAGVGFVSSGSFTNSALMLNIDAVKG
jgi:nicotinate-nucleotide pyrophosphorylase